MLLVRPHFARSLRFLRAALPWPSDGCAKSKDWCYIQWNIQWKSRLLYVHWSNHVKRQEHISRARKNGFTFQLEIEQNWMRDTLINQSLNETPTFCLLRERTISVPAACCLTHVRTFAELIKDRWKFSTRLHGRKNKFLCPRMQPTKVFYQTQTRKWFSANVKSQSAIRNIENIECE